MKIRILKLKKTNNVVLAFLTLLSLNMGAQNFSGKATYKTSSKFDEDLSNLNMTEEQEKQFRAQMRKSDQKTFILSFSSSESIYKQDEGLDAPQINQNSGYKMISLNGSGVTNVLYKNISQNRLTHKKEIQGKSFLIKEGLPQLNWEFTSETKSIGTYLCHKAIYKKEVIDTSSLEAHKDSEKTIVTILAWYTSDIPVNNGPENYWGLPGLILEVSDGSNLIVCTEVALDTNKTVELKEPKKGKTITREKFDKLKKLKAEETLEQLKSRNGLYINGQQIKVKSN